jgi:hypothetical protein
MWAGAANQENFFRWWRLPGGPHLGDLGRWKGLQDMTTAYDKRCTVILSLEIYEMFGD